MDVDSLNLRHLGAIAATVRYGTVTAAARAVSLTQPALTQAIARIEAALACAFFTRGPGGMTPTEPALFIAPRVEAAIALIGSPRVTGTQLRAFRAVARAGSYSVAAAQTGLSPASLHRAVKDLSLALGQRLVEKRGRAIQLTRAGERRARAFGLAMAELRAGLAEVDAWSGRAAGRVVIGAMPLSRAHWLPAAMVRFMPTHPGVEIVVVEGSHAELIGPLRDGEIDFLLGALRADDLAHDTVQEPAFEDFPQVFMRADHPLSGASPTHRDLARQTWVLPSRETPLRRYWEALFRRGGVEPPTVDVECGSVLTARELLLRTDALTLLSPDQLRVEVAAGLLVALPPPDTVVRTIGVTYRQGWKPTGPQAELLAILRDEANKVS